MSRAYYNEFDPKAAATLRELIANNLIAPGDVDERSITEVRAHELRGYTQCHFFAGAGIWSYAFRRGGIPDDRPAGSGSCPCQPFSAAGKGLGFEDPRHLWPSWHRLIAACAFDGQPWTDLLFGEQAPTAGAWVDLVSADMENLGYAFAAVDIPAAGFGGFHIRQRFYWVADANNAERWADLAPRNDSDWPKTGWHKGDGQPRAGGPDGRVADADGRDAGAEGLQRSRQHRQQPQDGGTGDGRGPVRGLGHAERLGAGWDAGTGAGPERGVELRPGGDDAGSPSPAGRLGHADSDEPGAGRRDDGQVPRLSSDARQDVGAAVSGRGSATGGLGVTDTAGLSDAEFGVIRLQGWRGEGRAAGEPGGASGAPVDWLLCRDSKIRPVEPGTCPLVVEAPERMGRLRLYGNALDAETAVNFVAAYVEAEMLS